MSDTNCSTKSSGGIGFAGLLRRPANPGFAGLLTILFIALKLIGVITWSWLWVISPLWISAAIALTIILGVLLVSLIVVGFTSSSTKKKFK